MPKKYIVILGLAVCIAMAAIGLALIYGQSHYVWLPGPQYPSTNSIT